MNQPQASLIVCYILTKLTPYMKDDLVSNDEADLLLNELIVRTQEFAGLSDEEALKTGDRLILGIGDE